MGKPAESSKQKHLAISLLSGFSLLLLNIYLIYESNINKQRSNEGNFYIDKEMQAKYFKEDYERIFGKLLAVGAVTLGEENTETTKSAAKFIGKAEKMTEEEKKKLENEIE